MPMTQIRRNAHPKGSLVVTHSHGMTTDPSRVTMRIRLEAIFPVAGGILGRRCRLERISKRQAAKPLFIS